MWLIIFNFTVCLLLQNIVIVIYVIVQKFLIYEL